MRATHNVIALLALAIFGGLALRTLRAQPAPGPEASPAATQPSVGAAMPATSPAAIAATRPATTFLALNFKDASVDAVLDHLSQVAGFVVVKDSGVGAITARTTVLSEQAVSPVEAIMLINTVLEPQHLTAIQQGRILKIETVDKVKKTNAPVYLGADPNLIEPTDSIRTQVIPLRNLDVIKLKQDLQPLISSGADLSANAAANSLIMTDSAVNVRRVVEIVFNLDKREAMENNILVKQLQYADATAAAKLIMDIFKTDEQAVSPNVRFMAQAGMRMGGMGGLPGFMGGGGGGAPQTQDKGQTGKVVASADQRTNTVVVSGPTDTLKIIEENLLGKLDADPSAEQSFFIYAVKNGQAQDMAITLNSLFGANTSSGGSSRTTSSISTIGNNSSGIGGGSGGRGMGTSSSSSNQPIARATPGQGVGGGAPSSSSLSSGAMTTAAALMGQVYVVADVDTNSLLVATARRFKDRVDAILKELDRPVAQVLIKVLIAQVTHSDTSDLGVDFAFMNLSSNNRGAQAISSFGNIGAKLPGAPAQLAQPAGPIINVLETNFQATLQAMITAGKIDILSRPYILATDNQLATITVGEEMPIITGSTINTTAGLGNQTTNSITYTQIGLTVNVTPHINAEGLVILDVNPQISSLDKSTPGTIIAYDGSGSPIYAPQFDNTSADTRVGIHDGQTIVIGGMMQDQNTETVSKVPVLGDIPGIGLLFQTKFTSKQKIETLIFLTPHVAPESQHLKAMSADEMKGMKLMNDAVEPGAFQDYMRAMDRGATRPTTLPAVDAQPATPVSSADKPSLPATGR